MNDEEVRQLTDHLLQQLASIQPELMAAFRRQIELERPRQVGPSLPVDRLIRHLDAAQAVLSQGIDPAARAVTVTFAEAGIGIEGIRLAADDEDAVDLVVSPGLRRLITQINVLATILAAERRVE